MPSPMEEAEARARLHEQETGHVVQWTQGPGNWVCDECDARWPKEADHA